jgi:diguanylate cyclase (GGDEF)-like protein
VSATRASGFRFPAAWHGARARVARGWRVPAACTPTHAALVRARIRTLAPLLALLTLAWIPFEVAWLGGAELMRSAPLRLGIAAALLLLAALVPRLRASLAVSAFFWLQAIGFGVLHWHVAAGQDAAAAVGYGLFPFILAAQLALLPLPWSRGLLAALAPAAQLAMTWWAPGSIAGTGNAPLLFVLIAAVAIWASHAQLRLLVDLLGARSDAAHDALTGLSNRRAASERLDAERRRAGRRGEPLSVLLLDLDHFKRVNDCWGHAAGDRVLVAVAQVLREELRGIDLAVRHGGEEFLAVLPGTGTRQALDVAARLRARIAREPVTLPPDVILGVTASIGVATLLPGESVASLVARADAALYAAKAAGRDCCVAAEGGDDAPLPAPAPAGA